MDKFLKIALTILFCLIIVLEFYNIYTHLNDDYRIQVVEQMVDDQQIEYEKLKYAFENRQKLDTLVININNKLETTNLADTMVVKFTNK